MKAIVQVFDEALNDKRSCACGDASDRICQDAQHKTSNVRESAESKSERRELRAK